MAARLLIPLSTILGFSLKSDSCHCIIFTGASQSCLHGNRLSDDFPWILRLNLNGNCCNVVFQVLFGRLRLCIQVECNLCHIRVIFCKRQHWADRFLKFLVVIRL
uniref:Putative secreted protein n=1 Tax=Ixodes ricinus TaxID=34613 RepID=A0A6B0UGE2_IXORI